MIVLYFSVTHVHQIRLIIFRCPYWIYSFRTGFWCSCLCTLFRIAEERRRFALQVLLFVDCIFGGMTYRSRFAENSWWNVCRIIFDERTFLLEFFNTASAQLIVPASTTISFETFESRNVDNRKTGFSASPVFSKLTKRVLASTSKVIDEKLCHVLFYARVKCMWLNWTRVRMCIHPCIDLYTRTHRRLWALLSILCTCICTHATTGWTICRLPIIIIVSNSPRASTDRSFAHCPRDYPFMVVFHVSAENTVRTFGFSFFFFSFRSLARARAA